MTNLRLFHPGIMEDAIRIRTTSAFSEDTPVDNLVNGERFTRGRLAATTSWIQTLDFELPSGTTQTADFWYGAVVDRLRSIVSDFSFRGANASYFAGNEVASITAWYDAAYQYDLTPGGKIINWYDRSGNGRTVSQATDANRLSLIPSAAGLGNGVNGFPCVRSSATTYTTAAHTLANFINAGRLTIWIAFKTPAAFSALEYLIEDNGGGFASVYIDSGGTLYFQAYDGATKLVTNALSGETVYLARIRHSGTNIYLSTNQGAESSTACGSITSLSTALQISDNSFPFTGDICEIIFSNQDVGSAQTPIDHYLLAKWVTDATWVEPYFNEAGLRGPRAADYVATFDETSAFRFWWAVYTPSGLTDLYHSKCWGGMAFDMGKEADYEIERIQPDEVDYTYDSGARRLERTTKPIYRIYLTWTGVTDAKVTSFQDIIARYSDNKTFALTTSDASSLHEILDNQRVIHCRLISAEVQKVGGVDDYNIVRAEFEEIIG